MCGTGDKECAICFFGDGGCVAAMLDDYWQKATEEQLTKRIEQGKYKDYTQLMIEAVKNWYNKSLEN